MAESRGGDEELAVERQLERHLEEQNESLATVKEALASDPSNPELIAVREELQLAIKDAEEGLLHLKRSRLLKEADSIFLSQEPESLIEDIKVEPLDAKQGSPEPLEPETYLVGSKCRFRHTDGRWYNGQIVALESANAARISFLTPTAESMLMCKFFLQQRCRFGSNCRLSHGFTVPFASLKPYIPTDWRQSLAGTSIWAISSGHSSIWRRAELESWDDNLSLGRVVFQDDGSSAKLGSEALCISEYADLSENDDDVGDDNKGDSLSSRSSSLSEEEEYSRNRLVNQGLGFLGSSASQTGVQTETTIFAKWEHHTRGIASKMMANMGYLQGTGLGASGQGMVDPISVRVLRPRQSLDHAVAMDENDKNNVARGKKRSRGGRRQQERKIAEAARAVKAEEEETDVFRFINNQLTGPNAANLKGNDRLKRGVGDGGCRMKGEDRRSLVAYEDEVKELRIRVEKLEEMVNRNRKDKAVFEAASRKLVETRTALADAEAAHASASNAVVSKEKEKKWLKF
ncbi:Zinc finger CCCH domain-containing protein 18 [Apostasia shenzhenica]|uniref:Zinc finger CCCH domain-containing protein 18 n=1 Tax=Apostasia shenzhenica TaxID=1088818 RepID=A0A2I0A1I4_9ASPA|nr:Zinc finger CCCH domain-containing protein 18 [Apostasia shenzhenica]